MSNPEPKSVPAQGTDRPPAASGETTPAGSAPVTVERCPNKWCCRVIDQQSALVCRCRHCGVTLKGNQLARRYPKPPGDDPAVLERLAERRAEILAGLGVEAVDVGPVKLGIIERFVILEMHVESWEAYFLRQGPVTTGGRVRAGYSQGYLASLVHLTRLAAVIGIDRQAREVAPTSVREWLAAGIEQQE
jgi:hypothetical protein